jgi:hypothetical protein
MFMLDDLKQWLEESQNKIEKLRDWL